MSLHLYAALLAADIANPVWLLVASVVGVAGTLATTWRPNKTSEAQVAINGLTNLTEALQAEVNRLGSRVSYLSFRVVTLEDQLRAAGLPIPPTQENR